MKLEDLPKKQVFNVPEGYFEQLPQRIQTRISGDTEASGSIFFQYKLQYALPALLILMVGTIWFMSEPKTDEVQILLSSVEINDMISFLDDSDITTEDVLENGSFNSDDADEIETKVYDLHFEGEDGDELIENINIENIEL